MSELVGFDKALVALKTKGKIRRAAWKDAVPNIVLKKPISKVAERNPWPDLMFFQAKKNKDGSEDNIPWVPGARDILAEDWVIV